MSACSLAVCRTGTLFSGQVHNFAENFCPPNAQLPGIFGSREFCRSALAGENSVSFDYALVEIPHEANWCDAFLSDFADFKAGINREQHTRFSPVKPDIQDAINRLSRNLQTATGEYIGFSPNQPVSLDVFDESTNHVSLMMLMRIRLKTCSKNESSATAGSVTLLHLKDKVVFVYAYRAYTGEESVKALKKFTTDWLARLEKANE